MCRYSPNRSCFRSRAPQPGDVKSVLVWVLLINPFIYDSNGYSVFIYI